MSRNYIFAVLLTAATCVSVPAWGQSPAPNITDFFASEVSAQPRLRDETHAHFDDVVRLRHALDNALHLGRRDDIEAILDTLRPEFRAEHPELVDLALIFQSSFDDDRLSRERLLNALEGFQPGNDWYAGVYADAALSVLYMREWKLLLAGQYTQSALQRIPEERSALVRDAHLILAEQMIMLYGMSADPERMLDASETSRRIHAELGLDFNRYELMTNFLFAFNQRRDHAGATAMAELLQTEARPEDIIDGLAEVYIADMLNETGDHAGALDMAQLAVRAKDPFVIRRAKGEAMIAYAGLGQKAKATQLMQELGFWGGNAATSKAELSEAALHALALLAAADGKTAEGLSLMNQRLDLMIGNLRRTSAADTSALLSHLENSRERQQERENALAREAQLKATQLRQQTRINVMLLLLLALVASAFVALFFFNRYRERLNREMSALQEEALSAEKMKSEFLGVINHELRTPLNGVIGISDALIHHSTDERTRTQAKAIQQCGDTLFDLVESLIDMSTLEGGKMELVPDDIALGPVIAAEATRWTEAAQAKGLAFTQFIAPELSRTVMADADRLRQCVKILLSNATRFTHEGRVHLHATASEQDGALEISIIVADTGQGISETVQARLFKPFLQADSTMTRKYGGAGLNLAIARKLARMMGGDVTVTSAKDRGSEFIFSASLPLAQVAEAEPTEKPVAEPEPRLATDADILELGADHVIETQDTPAPTPIEPLAPVHDLMIEAPQIFEPAERLRDGLDGAVVLIVEDMPSNQDVIRLMLEPEGCDCLEALSGEEALAVLATQTVDAIVMDIRMPVMDGIETTQRIRALGGNVGQLPIIVLTADAGSETNAKAVTAGANLFLTKPVISKDLVEALEFVLSETDAVARNRA